MQIKLQEAPHGERRGKGKTALVTKQERERETSYILSEISEVWLVFATQQQAPNYKDDLISC